VRTQADVPGARLRTVTITQQQIHELAPFTATLGVEFERMTADEVVAGLDVTPARCTVGSTLHGGALMGLTDSTAAVCAVLNLPSGATGTTTIAAATNFLRPAPLGRGTATARPLHRGRTTVVVEVDVLDGEGRLVARTTQTQGVVAA
jgi:1,4-dihydroxy-2-naphthoyl-CoA hydrolase